MMGSEEVRIWFSYSWRWEFNTAHRSQRDNRCWTPSLTPRTKPGGVLCNLHKACKVMKDTAPPAVLYRYLYWYMFIFSHNFFHLFLIKLIHYMASMSPKLYKWYFWILSIPNSDFLFLNIRFIIWRFSSFFLSIIWSTSLLQNIEKSFTYINK